MTAPNSGVTSYTASLPAFRLVLVEPRSPGNFGLCVRAAANFGVREIVLVQPKFALDDPEVLARTVAPSDAFLKLTRTVPSLQQALKDCTGAAGFTRRTGKDRSTLPLRSWLRELSAGSRPRKAAPFALVFGNEKTGLSREDLALCSHRVTIPTADLIASLNLSHAVAVVLARVHEEFSTPLESGSDSAPLPRPATLGELDQFLAHWRTLLIAVGMTQAGNPDRFVGRLRDLFMGSTSRDLTLLRGFLSKAQVALRRGRRN